MADAGYEVHYLTKKVFSELIQANPLVDKLWTIEDDLDSVILALQKEAYFKVLDLHDNLRSIKVRKSLRRDTVVFDKQKLSNFLWTRFKIKPSKTSSISQRFVDTTAGFCKSTLPLKPSFPLEPSVMMSLAKYNLPASYYCIAVGAGWATKQLPSHKLQEVLYSLSSDNIVLLGGPGEESLVQKLKCGPRVINLVGRLSIMQSGAVVEKATALLAGDTGLMHIAAALEVPVVAVFGSTHPDMGYAPNDSGDHPPIIIQNTHLKCRPCTKHGRVSCPKAHFKCMEDIDMTRVVSALKSIPS